MCTSMKNPLGTIRALFLKKSRGRPLHVAINCYSLKVRLQQLETEEEKKSFLAKYLAVIEQVISQCIVEEIPILSILLLRTGPSNNDEFIQKGIAQFFKHLALSPEIQEHQVKISVLGKWYDANADLIDAVKFALDETKLFDRFFVNFLVFYDGQEEIMDGMRIIQTKIDHEKIEPKLNYAVVKDNLASSYFIPPDLLFIPDNRRSTDGILLWDQKNTKLVLTDKMFEREGESEFLKAIKYFRSA